MTPGVPAPPGAGPVAVGVPGGRAGPDPWTVGRGAPVAPAAVSADVRRRPRRTVLTWRSPGRPALRVHVAAPAVLTSRTRLCVVLHGTERNAADYCAPWAGWAVSCDRVVLAPEFDRASWPGSRAFSLGGVLDRAGVPQPRERRAFPAVTDLCADLVARLGLADGRFDLWGHSAGAQFVHRYLLFEPAAPVRTAVAANAGWYTLPDLHRPFPYGLAHPALQLSADDVARWVTTPLVLMRGSRDVLRDAHLRATAGADEQGPHRHARAATMLRAGRAADAGCRWRLVEVPGAGHDFVPMAAAAQELLGR